MKVTIIFSSVKPVANKLAMDVLTEVNDLLQDGQADEAATKLGEFMEYVEVIDASEETQEEED